MGLWVRPHRYALGIACGLVAAGVLGLHECDNPVCVKVAAEGYARHVVSGTQGDNMERMARVGRGGGPVRRFDSRGVRRDRSVALREAVRNGWDGPSLQTSQCPLRPPRRSTP